ncbi:glycosyltransferase [Litoribacter ruber]|uniref:glycosyltransferase n=1 Tax=Litoribacter ruber TaxID=702568 RepID=UPI001BDAA300|nr:glycosyltransferase [Litoribacter ruber]MBT0812920.1 glycosyltransferase [Litoribacter ruber]
MKILCVIDSLGSGGAQRQMVELAIGFKKKGNEVSFLIYHAINFFESDLCKYNIPVQIVNESKYIVRFSKLRRAIRQEKPDAVLSFLEGPNLICEMAGLPSKNWKLVVGERSANPRILNSLKGRIFRWFHFFADKIVSNSHENLRMVKKANPLLATKNIHVIYNIIDRTKWNPFSNVNRNALEEDRFHLIVVGSLREVKNPLKMIEAIYLLSEQEKRRLTVDWYGSVHSQDYRDSVKELISKYDLEEIINFHPPVKDIHIKIAASDALGLFSILEGLPNTICEAMMMGKPVIASSVSDIPILLNNQREFLFNPNDVVDIKEKISYLLSLSSEEIFSIGNGNYNHAQTLLDENFAVESYLNLFSGKM